MKISFGREASHFRARARQGHRMPSKAFDRDSETCRKTKEVRKMFRTPGRLRWRSTTRRTTCPAVKEDAEEDFVRANGDFFRALPLYIGTLSFLFVLVNRAVSGLGLVADARSAQSRVDVLCIVMSASLVLTGLSWISLKPRRMEVVEPDGVDCLCWTGSISKGSVDELKWTWNSFRETSRVRSMAVFYMGRCIFIAGKVASQTRCDVDGATMGSIIQRSIDTGQQSYLANLVLFPGRVEFDFFPRNTQAILVHPIGNKGAIVMGADTIRGLTPADQAWISVIADKLEVTLEEGV